MNRRAFLYGLTPRYLPPRRSRRGRVCRIVMVISADAVGLGCVASLARPGANVAGITSPLSEVA
jgi:hypothetical protein